MLSIIENNPYRILGVYSNSSTRECVANQGKINAFLKVEKPIDFPLDLSMLIPPIIRTLDSVSNSIARITLPGERFKYARFWFMKSTPLDDIAFNHLLNGDIAKAISAWEENDNPSSLQNRIVCALIRGDNSIAMSCAEKLYSQYAENFVETILGMNNTIPIENIEHEFIDVLLSELDENQILSHVSNQDWKDYILSKIVEPLINQLESAILEAKSTIGKSPISRYQAGIKLMNSTKATFLQLKSMLSESDFRYIKIADKLGLGILQCAIDYYNRSDEDNRAQKAMELQNYALSIVVGSYAKQRCKENADILNNIVSILPSMEAMTQYNSIMGELMKYSRLPYKSIGSAEQLLKNTKSDLSSMKTVLGPNNKAYLQLSTLIVKAALHNIIEEVNNTLKPQEKNSADSILLPYMSLPTIKLILTMAWNATLTMDTFDIENDFRDTYNRNRSTLKQMCIQVGIIKDPLQPKPTQKQQPVNNKGCLSEIFDELGGCLSEMAEGLLGCLLKAGILCLIMFVVVSLIRACSS